MKKTQPIDWDKVIFEELPECIFVYFNDRDKYVVIDSDFIAAFDEMLEYYLENRLERWFCKWDDKKGWILDVNKHKWKSDYDTAKN